MNIQDEAYSEAMDELERWKVQHEEMLLKHAREQHAALSTLDEAMKEIARLKGEVERMTDQAIKFRDMAEKQGYLLARAADALEYSPAESHVHLIALLRKAAE